MSPLDSILTMWFFDSGYAAAVLGDFYTTKPSQNIDKPNAINLLRNKFFVCFDLLTSTAFVRFSLFYFFNLVSPCIPLVCLNNNERILTNLFQKKTKPQCDFFYAFLRSSMPQILV